MFESKPCRILQTAYIPVSNHRGSRIRVWNVNSPKSKGKLYSYALCEHSTVSVGGSLSDVHEAACQLFFREQYYDDVANYNVYSSSVDGGGCIFAFVRKQNGS